MEGKKKLFVGGLLRSTTDDSLREHFSKYGTVESSSVCLDWNTGNSRGFGFVSFSDSSSAENALRETHVIHGRQVEVNEAKPEGERHTQQHMGLRDGSISNDLFRNKKIFVGGLASNVTEEELRKYFEEFGTITDAVVIHDKATNLSRGFGFITFESEESLEKVTRSRFYYLGGKPVEVKRAVPKDGNNNINGYQHGRHPYYGYGFEIPLHFPPMSWYHGYGGGWPMGAYGGMVYGVPYISPCFHWNDTWRIGAGGCTSYPSYVNCRVGVVGTDGAYDGFNGVDLYENIKMDELVCSDAAPEVQRDLEADQ